MFSCGEGAVVGFGSLLVVGFWFADAAGAREGFEAEAAAVLGPFVVLLGEDGFDEANDRLAVREDADNIGAAANLAVESFGRVVGPDLLPDLFREHGEREDLFWRGLEVGVRAGQVVLERVQDPVEPSVHRLRVGLVEHAREERPDPGPGAPRRHTHQIRRVMGSSISASPRPAGWRRPRRPVRRARRW